MLQRSKRHIGTRDTPSVCISKRRHRSTVEHCPLNTCVAQWLHQSNNHHYFLQYIRITQNSPGISSSHAVPACPVSLMVYGVPAVHHFLSCPKSYVLIMKLAFECGFPPKGSSFCGAVRNDGVVNSEASLVPGPSATHHGPVGHVVVSETFACRAGFFWPMQTCPFEVKVAPIRSYRTARLTHAYDERTNWCKRKSAAISSTAHSRN